jgi:type II secretory pathway component PulC
MDGASKQNEKRMSENQNLDKARSFSKAYNAIRLLINTNGKAETEWQHRTPPPAAEA